MPGSVIVLRALISAVIAGAIFGLGMVELDGDPLTLERVAGRGGLFAVVKGAIYLGLGLHARRRRS